MKEDWERTQQPAPLDLKQIHAIIRPAFPGQRIIAAERFGTGLSNANYKVEVEGSSEPYVVRLYSGTGEVADKEIAITQHVRETVPVAEFIYADTSCRTYPKPWAVLEWKDGVLLSDVMSKGTQREVAAAVASAGSQLARIHAYSFEKSGFFNRDLEIRKPIKRDAAGFLAMMEQNLFHKTCGKWLGGELVEKLWAFCQKYSSALSENREASVLVHSDFNGLNILVQPELEGCPVSAVLDWEFAFSWSRYADIGNMLRYEEEGSEVEKHFVQAYREHGGSLATNWKLLSKLEDLLALCEMLNTSTSATPKRRMDLHRLIAKTINTY